MQTPVRLTVSLRAAKIAALASLASLASAAPRALAQAAAAATTTTARTDVSVPARAQVDNAADSSTRASGEPVQLNAFEVQADRDNSYGALNSASITRFNVEMDKMPVSADIFTETFMKDVAVSAVEDVIQGYSAGAGFANGDGSGGATAAVQPGDRNSAAFIQLRGMNTPAMQRDGFMPVGSFGNPGSTAIGRTDNFDLERVEVISGPQALLYGGGGAGGIINITSKQARFSSSGGLVRNIKGEANFRVDQYGTKRAETNFGSGNQWFAFRMAFLRESLSSRRINIGADTNGQYAQLAFRFFQNTVPTTIRLSGSLTMNRRMLPAATTLTAPGDARHGMQLHYILATGQQFATNPATGAPYAAGAILGGRLNWSNVDSLAGNSYQEPISNDYSSITVDTQWTKWLTTQVGAGYDTYTDRGIRPNFSVLAPNAGANTTGNWAAGATLVDSWQPARTKAGRVAALITKDLWDHRANTQTLIGADFIRTDFAQIGYNWYQADANWNTIIAPGSTLTSANSGRTALGQVRWSINDGAVLYPFGDQNPARDRMVINGTNYVRELMNAPQRSLVTLQNPQGTPLTSGNYIQTKIFNKGIYAVNYTQWFGGKLNTLVGIRQGDYVSDRIQHYDRNRSRYLAIASQANFNLGIDYSVNRHVHPYVNYSDSVQPPYVANRIDPFGNAPGSSHGVGSEVGIKLNNAQNTLSGSLAVFRTSSKGDLYGVNGSIVSAINPTGLNGGGNGGGQVSVDRVTRGLELRLTAAPTPNWRLRLGLAANDGEIGTTKAYEQVYNDQFYANSSGQVTYRNGTVVYVNGSATTAAQATVVPSTAAGAVPLTINLMSTPGASNLYYADPDPTSGRINPGVVVVNILSGTNNAANINANGPILTGQSMLPISELQLNKTLAGINPPGVIVATRVGDKTTGYPEYSANFTGHYTFPADSWLKGFGVGGTTALSWRNRAFYYFATPITPANALAARRTLHYAPNTQQLNLIFSYSRKIGRYVWSSQLNIANVFNHYTLWYQPNGNTGFNTITAINASWAQQPRMYVWTNSVKF